MKEGGQGRIFVNTMASSQPSRAVKGRPVERGKFQGGKGGG